MLQPRCTRIRFSSRKLAYYPLTLSRKQAPSVAPTSLDPARRIGRRSAGHRREKTAGINGETGRSRSTGSRWKTRGILTDDSARESESKIAMVTQTSDSANRRRCRSRRLERVRYDTGTRRGMAWNASPIAWRIHGRGLTRREENGKVRGSTGRKWACSQLFLRPSPPSIGPLYGVHRDVSFLQGRSHDAARSSCDSLPLYQRPGSLQPAIIGFSFLVIFPLRRTGRERRIRQIRDSQVARPSYRQQPCEFQRPVRRGSAPNRKMRTKVTVGSC